MNDIGNLMRQLPRATASPSFTDDVLRAAARNERPLRLWLRVAASAAILVLVAGLYAASLHRSRQIQLDALRAEHEQIETDLRQVKAAAAGIEPVIVLENGDTRVIVEADHNSSQQSRPVYY